MLINFRNFNLFGHFDFINPPWNDIFEYIPPPPFFFLPTQASIDGVVIADDLFGLFCPAGSQI